MFKKVLIGLVVVIAAFLAFVATRPAEFRLERSTTVAAPADVVFASVNDLHKWGQWSPWEKKDPNMKKTFEGAAAGVGASYSWASDKVGEGKMTIAESQPGSRIGIKLEFIKPFAATNNIEFLFKPAAGGTQVTWAMSGNNNFMGKLFHVFMDMDKMVGPDFEQGLASLKTLSEADAARLAAAKKAAEGAQAAAPTP